MILDVAPLELMILGGVALLVIPPKDLPRAMRFAGQWVGKARGLARQFRSGFDDMIREAEFAEMEKKWKAENERIMREFPQATDPVALPSPDAVTGAVTGEAPVDPGAPVIVEQPVIVTDPAPPEPAVAADPAPVAAAEPAPEPPTAKPRARAKADATSVGKSSARTKAAGKPAGKTKAAARAKAAPAAVPGE